uniref:zinc finger protein 454-like n=1 Tax=Doryrhamphus excisus TaxID=161450 RepID=UPI0025AE3F13|nr:zinc finger protein 454-like [Doryrhamphus excisus]
MEARRADISGEALPPDQQEWISSVEQGRPQPANIKEEEKDQVWTQEEADISKFSAIRVIVKSEDDEEGAQWLQLHDSPSEETKRSEADSLILLFSDSDDTASHSRDSDEEGSKADITCHTDNKHFKCSQCNTHFRDRSTLITHSRTHTGEKLSRCGRHPLVTALLVSFLPLFQFPCSYFGNHFLCCSLPFSLPLLFSHTCF